MDLRQLILLPPATFAKLIEDDYFNCNGIYIIEVYNALVEHAMDHSLKVIALANAAVEIYLSQDKPDEAILYLELRIRAELCRKAFDVAMQLLERIVGMNHERSESTVLELAEDILGDIDGYGVSVDQRPMVMSKIAAFLGQYDQSQRVGELYLDAALLYSRHGASPAAYRCVADAKKLQNPNRYCHS